MNRHAIPHVPWARAALCAACLSVAPLAQADPLGFDPQDRAALGAEIRSLLLDEPDLVARALTPPSAYQQAVSDDIARLERLAPRLFDPGHEGFGPADAESRIALFVADDCADCDRAAADLRAMAASHDLRVTLLRLSDPAAAALAAELELADMPAYVLPRMMLQGHIPPVVLERYLSR
jgi:hypothetical protein